MFHKNADCILDGVKPKEVVSLPVSLFKSMQGKYFVGQTEPLWVGNDSFAWAALVNPKDSGVYIYANVFTISNLSDDYLTAEIWLNADFPSDAKISAKKVSPTNTALRPFPKNKVDIKYVESTTELPQHGVNVYQRIVPPYTTLVGEEDGKFIESPCGNYTIIIKSLSSKTEKVKAIVALGWWEKQNAGY